MVGIRREVEVSPVVALELGISHFLPSLFLFFSLFFRLDYNLHGFDFYHSCFLLGGRIFNLTHLGSGLVILGQTTPPLWECLLCTTAYLLLRYLHFDLSSARLRQILDQSPPLSRPADRAGVARSCLACMPTYSPAKVRSGHAVV